MTPLHHRIVPLAARRRLVHLRNVTVGEIRWQLGRFRRIPTNAPGFPTPAAPAEPLALEHVLVSSDLNPRFLDCWPIAKRSWKELAGLDATLVVIGERHQLPEALQADPSVRTFTPIEGRSSSFQAQLIRLVYPALLRGGGVLITDADMIPMNSRYFHRTAAVGDRSHFVAYRDVILDIEQIPIC